MVVGAPGGDARRRSASRRRDAAGEPAPYLLAIHALRRDLQAAFPDPLGADAAALAEWGWVGGVREGIDPALLGPPPDPAARRALARSRVRREAAARVRRLPVRSAGLAAGRGLLAAERHAFGGLPGRDERLMRAVRAAAKEARQAYWAEPWPGRLVHLRSAEHRHNPLMDGWWALALDGVVEAPLDAAHIAMLREPDVARTAAALPGGDRERSMRPSLRAASAAGRKGRWLGPRAAACTSGTARRASRTCCGRTWARSRGSSGARTESRGSRAGTSGST